MNELNTFLVVLGLLTAVHSTAAGDPGTTRGIIDISKQERPADAVTLVGPDAYNFVPESAKPTKWVFADGILTAYQNGERIHDDYSITGKTGVGEKEGPEARPIKLQGHHNPVRFRNVWIQKLTLDAEGAN